MRYEAQTALTVNTQAPPVDKPLEYLSDRLNSLRWEKTLEIEKAFSDPRPSSVKEMKEWLKSGNYRIRDNKNDDEDRYNGMSCHFQWGKTAPDKKAEEAAQAEMLSAYQSALDTVSVMTDEQLRLKTLQDFEAKKFH